MNVLQYTEWERPRVTTLSDAEVRVASRLSSAIMMEMLPNGRCRLGPKPGFVGSAQLSKQTVIVVKPRFSQNEFASLLSLAYQDRSFPTLPGIASLGEGDPSAWYFAQLYTETSKLVRHGIRRGYVSLTEDRPSPRGRLHFSGRSPSISGSHSCSTDDFVRDSLPNRIVKGIIGLAVARCADPSIRRGLARLSRELDDISSTRPTQLEIERVMNDPLYRPYFPTMRLSLLLIKKRGTEFESGEIGVSSFFFRLFDIFELALFNSIRAVASSAFITTHHPRDSASARIVHGKPALKITFEPDIGLKSRPSIALSDPTGAWATIVDAKYTRPLSVSRFGHATFENGHVYQIMAYSKIFDAPGVLVYPRIDDDVDISYRVGTTAIRIFTVDLRTNAVKNLRETAISIIGATSVPVFASC